MLDFDRARSLFFDRERGVRPSTGGRSGPLGEGGAKLKTAPVSPIGGGIGAGGATGPKLRGICESFVFEEELRCVSVGLVAERGESQTESSGVVEKDGSGGG